MRRLRNIVPVVLFACLASASAAAGAAPGCANPAESALNQYCDSIPSSVGPKPPWVGSQPLAASLPRRVLGRLHGAGKGASARRRLLALPVPIMAARSTAPSGGASLWSLARSMIALLVAIALGLVAAAAARHRRRGTGSRRNPPRPNAA